MENTHRRQVDAPHGSQFTQPWKMMAGAGETLEIYCKVEEFLNSRNLQRLLPSFVAAKIDDAVASQIQDEAKLMELGLVYGDVIAYRQFFNTTSSVSLMSYKERAAELKYKIRRAHSGKKDILNRPVSIQKTYHIHFGLKCKEKDKYRLKLNKSVSKIFPRYALYNDLLQFAKRHFGTGETSVYLAPYCGTQIQESFACVENYALQQREKKRAIRLYLHYPHSYTHLGFNKMKNVACNLIQDDEGDFDDISDISDISSNSQHNLHNPSSSSETSSTAGALLDAGADVQPLRLRRYTKKPIRFRQSVGEKDDYVPNSDSSNSSNIPSIPSLQTNTATSNEGTKVICCFGDEETDQFLKNKVDERSLAHIQPKNEEECTLQEIDNILQEAKKSSPSIPSLQTNTATSNEGTKVICCFGDEEADQFLKNKVDERSLAHIQSKNEEECTSQEIDNILQEAKTDYFFLDKSDKTIIVQRSPEKFWIRILGQSFDLSKHELSVRFAGEAAADAGGPLREFLTLCMKTFSEVPSAFFGDKENLFFSANPELLVQKHYFTLGQLTALSILVNGRGPEVLSPALVKVMFEVNTSQEISVKDAYVENELQNITNGNYDALFNENITPFGKKVSEMRQLFIYSYVILKRFAAINQFKEGLSSISEALKRPTSYNVMKRFLEHNDLKYSFQHIISLINYPQQKSLQVGSNSYNKLVDAVGEFEVLLSLLESNEVEIDGEYLSLNDFLFFATGTDHIPPFGFEKSIDVSFDDSQLPTSSTCGLSVVFPYKNLIDGFKIGWKFGGGFGKI